MSHFTNVLRATTAAVLVAGFAGLGPATATADPDPSTGNQSDIDTLAASLSRGYDLTICTPDLVTGGQLAALNCGQSPVPNGPAQARYVLFSNGSDLTNSFNDRIKGYAQTTCGSTQSPTFWGRSGAKAGLLACGTYQDAAEILWTTDSKSVLSYVRGSNTDVNALYQWWLKYG